MTFEAAHTTHYTLITPPSLYVSQMRPNILLLGPGQAWKTTFLEKLDASMDGTPYSVYLTEKEEQEDIYWLYHHLRYADFVFAFVTTEWSTYPEYFAMLGQIQQDSNTFISFAEDPSLQNVKAIVTQSTCHDININPSAHIDRAAEIWRRR